MHFSTIPTSPEPFSPPLTPTYPKNHVPPQNLPPYRAHDYITLNSNCEARVKLKALGSVIKDPPRSRDPRARETHPRPLCGRRQRRLRWNAPSGPRESCVIEETRGENAKHETIHIATQQSCCRCSVSFPKPVSRGMRRRRRRKCGNNSPAAGETRPGVMSPQYPSMIGCALPGGAARTLPSSVSSSPSLCPFYLRRPERADLSLLGGAWRWELSVGMAGKLKWIFPNGEVFLCRFNCPLGNVFVLGWSCMFSDAEFQSWERHFFFMRGVRM